MQVVLVGESPGKAGTLKTHSPLYPLPKKASGDRLCQLMGLKVSEYLAMTVRVNLVPYPTEKWPATDAAWMAAGLSRGGLLAGKKVILLGQKVKAAFSLASMEDFEWRPYESFTVASIPHPSGLNRKWNRPDVKAASAYFFQELGIDMGTVACSHPSVTYRYWSNTGNYDPSEDVYGIDISCKRCGDSKTFNQKYRDSIEKYYGRYPPLSPQDEQLESKRY